MNRLRSETGQAAVLSVVFMAALLGAVAMVLDVGSWFREQRATQSAADAAALAGAQELPESTGLARCPCDAVPRPRTAAVSARSRSRPGSWRTTRSTSESRVRHRACSRSSSGSTPSTCTPTRVRAPARLDSAQWAAPIAVDKSHPLLNCKPRPCFNVATTLDLQKTGPGAFRLLNLDLTKGGTGGKIDADWILRGFEGYMPLGWYGSDPGAAFNDDKFDDALNIRIGDELLFPSTTRSRAAARTSNTGWSAGSDSSSRPSTRRGARAPFKAILSA